ncbi:MULTISPECIES: DUF5710 domain-containing protein [unclassified Acinetobacter]|uniref:DUF5710 domain-containing protein n=1 Tax=unclassified Acinetobacter TaxID=196816 RepID=UPI0015D41E1D|nr:MULTISPECIES: DUF5710 domain-containing protein [unclassified Acinetobacter]UUS62517.1 DUF5710 domain-containing protein [Acinetobacter sp. YH16056_T]
MKKEYVQDIADRLIEQIKSNTAPWQKPWEGGKTSDFLPINLNTGRPYRGMNLVNLMSVAEELGFSDNRWITYKGAEKLGAQVRKGEKSTSIHYWKFSDEVALKDDDGKPVLDKDGKQVTVQVKLDKPRVFFANVFNAEQIDGLPPKEQTIKPLDEWERHKRAEEILEASGVKIRHKAGDSAYYKPSIDEITLPLKEQFPTADSYYATALHELGHSTGHPSRLNRDLSGGFGSENYAKEELRAEMASLFIGQELQIGHDPGQHIAYLKSWVKVLEDDPKEIFRAARDADLISSYLLDLSQEQKIENSKTEDQNLENTKQVFLMRQEHTELDQSIKALNKISKKAGLALALSPNGDNLKGNFLKNGVEVDPYVHVHKDGSIGFIENIDSPMIVKERPEALLTAITALSQYRDAITISSDAYKFIKKVQAEEEKTERSDFSNNFEKLTDELKNQFTRNGVAALVDIKKVGSREALKFSYVGESNELHHYSTNMNEKGFLSIAFNGVDTPSSNTASVDKHLGDMVGASLAYVDLLHTRNSNSDEVMARVKSYKENGLGDSPQTTWKNLSKVAQENGLFARISDNILPHTFLTEEEREQQPKFIINYADQGQVGLEVNTLVFANGKAVTLTGNEEYEAIKVTSDPLTQEKNLLALANAELSMTQRSNSIEKTYIDVGFGDKEEAKQLGAKWDGKAKAWYVPAGVDIAPFEKWKVITPEEQTQTTVNDRKYINVPKEEKDEAKQLGAKWDRVQKSWYVPAGVDIALFEKWTESAADVKQAADVKHDVALSETTQKFLKDLTASQEYDHSGYTILYATDLVPAMQSDEEIERAGEYIKQVVETGVGLNLKENKYILDTVNKLKKEFHFSELYTEDEEQQQSPVPMQIDLNNVAPMMKDQVKNIEQQEEVLEQTEKTYLAVPYEEKDEAKQLGARFDADAKSWYVPAGINSEPFEKWLPHNQNHIDLPDTSKSIRPEDEFKAALLSAGLMVQGDPIMDGKMHRVPVEGDVKGKLGGAYKGFLDGRPAGYIRNFKTGLEEKWKSNSVSFNVVDTARMRAEMAQNRANNEKRLELLYEKTADQAAIVYGVSEVAQSHPYLEKKGLNANDVIKIVPGPEALPPGCDVKIATTWQEAKQWREQNKENGINETILTKGDLLVPGYSADGKLMMLQTINSNGFKGYMKDAKKSGSFAIFGNIENGKPFLIAEGVATALTLHEQTKQPVVASFDSGNLLNVAKELRDKYLESKIYIAADNDHIVEAKNRESGKRGMLNPGVEYALQAANEIQGFVLTPKFAKNDVGTDWNDLFQSKGKVEFQDQMRSELFKAKSLEVEAKAIDNKITRQNEVGKAQKEQLDQRESVKMKR